MAVNYQSNDLDLNTPNGAITETRDFSLNNFTERFTKIQDYINGTRTKVNDFKNFQFTYVVDSNQALQDWAGNVAGNDYTSVLIKSGSYTLSKGIDLTSTSTINLIGEIGSEINFNSVENAISYDTIPSQGHIENITVNNNKAGQCKGFVNCINLFNCTSNVNSYNSFGNPSHAFENCKNLYNCYAYAETSNSSAAGDGFIYCINLYNCMGTGVGTNTTNCGGTGFLLCENIYSCVASGNGSGKISNERGGIGFRSCKRIINSTGVGTPSTENSSQTGFLNCFSVQNCIDESESLQFYNSYFSSSANLTYACADTLEGGWNRILS